MTGVDHEKMVAKQQPPTDVRSLQGRTPDNVMFQVSAVRARQLSVSLSSKSGNVG